MWWTAALLENIGNAITRLPMDLDVTWVVASHYVLDMSVMMQLPWQRQPLSSNRALNL